MLTIACVLLLASIATCQDSEAFRADLDAVQNSMHRGGWKSARKKLDEILATYEKKPFVIARRHELIELCRRCDFASNHAAPKPADLITGKLVAYDERSGRIKLDYDVSNIGDFTKIGDFLHHP
ncbi:MAG TPA: hypothetical protein PKE00_16500, partial [Planctomycetota bacterium]|nr:hypothetical protein [Planctomycetota bacterium]